MKKQLVMAGLALLPCLAIAGEAPAKVCAPLDIVKPSMGTVNSFTTQTGTLNLVIKDLSQANAEVRIRDYQGAVFFKERLTFQGGILKKYDISQLGSGKYQVEVNMGNSKFCSVFTVQ